MTSVVIVNQHTNNFGDDAAGAALIDNLVDSISPERIDVFYIWHGSTNEPRFGTDVCNHHWLEDLSGARDVRPRYALAAAAAVLVKWVIPAQMKSLVKRCKVADLVFVSPAGSNIGIYKDWTYLFVLVLLVATGIRPIFCQNTIGPSRSVIFNAVSKYVLRRSTIYVREIASQDWLATKQIGSSLGVDTAFALTPAAARRRDQRPFIALVPTQLSNWHRDHRDLDDEQFFNDVLLRALGEIAQMHGLEVVIIPHLYGPASEEELLTRVRSHLTSLGCEARIAAETENYRDYLRWISDSEIVVSMRYHGLVLAALNSVPCVSLAYENKMLEAARYCDLHELSLNIRHATPSVIIEKLELALTQRNAYSEALSARVSDLRSIALGPIREALSHSLRA